MLTRRGLILGTVAAFVCATVAVLAVGSALSWPVNREVGPPPDDLHARSVQFESASGASISAWFGSPSEGDAVVVLSHAVRGSRRNLVQRSKFLRDAGFGVLAYDAQSHGESTGERITFGHLEAHDARAAVEFARLSSPQSRIGYIGPSLAGAAALLGEEPLPVDALVLEAVYPTLRSAVFNRVAIRTGKPLARLLTPLLLLQVEPRLGFDPYVLNPVDRIGAATAPILLIAGSEDRHTTLAESQALYDAATHPKELWVVSGAAHQSFHGYAPEEYERRIVSFFGRHLSYPRRMTSP